VEKPEGKRPLGGLSDRMAGGGLSDRMANTTKMPVLQNQVWECNNVLNLLGTDFSGGVHKEGN
jgi:hypothetical protein